MTPEQKRFIHTRKEFAAAALACGLSDPFNYGRGNEGYAAIIFGHTISKTLEGADAINEKGELLEYKSTIAETMRATYSGISVQPTWEKQVKYLKEKKILKYPKHYIYRTDKAGNICEAYVLSGQDVYNCLLPKLKKSFECIINTERNQEIWKEGNLKRVFC